MRKYHPLLLEPCFPVILNLLIHSDVEPERYNWHGSDKSLALLKGQPYCPYSYLVVWPQKHSLLLFFYCYQAVCYHWIQPYCLIIKHPHVLTLRAQSYPDEQDFSSQNTFLCGSWHGSFRTQSWRKSRSLGLLFLLPGPLVTTRGDKSLQIKYYGNGKIWLLLGLAPRGLQGSCPVSCWKIRVVPPWNIQLMLEHGTQTCCQEKPSLFLLDQKQSHHVNQAVCLPVPNYSHSSSRRKTLHIQTAGKNSSCYICSNLTVLQYLWIPTASTSLYHQGKKKYNNPLYVSCNWIQPWL